MTSRTETAHTLIGATVLLLAVAWMVVPDSWLDSRDDVHAAPAAPMPTAAEINHKLDVVLGPVGTLVEEGLLLAAIEFPEGMGITGDQIAVTVGGVRRVWKQSPTGMTWMRVE